MKAIIVVLGIIFLIIGVLTYYLPIQEFKASTANSGDVVSTRITFGEEFISLRWTLLLVILGLILLISGFTIPDSKKRVNDNKIDNNN